MNKNICLGFAGLLLLAAFGCDSSSDDAQSAIVVDSGTDSQDDASNQVSNNAIDTIDASEDIKELEVVIRDFQAGYPDFDNFQSEAYESQTVTNNFDTWIYPGYADNEDWLSRRVIPSGYATYGCGNATTPEYGTPLPNVWYGEFGFCGGSGQATTMRGLVTDFCTDAIESWNPDTPKQCDKYCLSYLWSKQVYVTQGMVKQNLAFPKDEYGKPNLREPLIEKARDACDNKYFEQWFSDNDLNKRSDGTIALDSLGESSSGIKRDWNNGGFYPLDSVSERMEWVRMNEKFENQFGPQSMNIYCPPYQYPYAATQTDNKGESTASLCTTWLLEGGPRVPEAALNAAMKTSTGLRHFRNAGFTMMAYAPFKYKKDANKVFEFASLGDLWVFVDGVLALDLGGTHLVANGNLDLKKLAAAGYGCHAGEPLEAFCEGRVDEDGAWKDGTWHHIHIFYADRSSDGSTLYLKF